MADITVRELSDRLKAGTAPLIIDVREPHETALGYIPTAQLIPMGQLPLQLEELAGYKDKEVVLVCRSGGRSSAMASFMASNGFRQVRNLVGGTLAWQAEIDPSLQV
ncbi:MAG: rhodanese-like domain-containing protein [Bacteroidia bacterium]|nr:rhodanese-like domain-containing protein [Bacteroidia bacterium]